MVEQALRDYVDNMVLSERLQKLKQRYFEERSQAASERITLAAESWRETEGQDVEIRRAKLLQRILEGIPLVINEGELTAGNTTKFFRGSYPYVDWDGTYFDKLVVGGKLPVGAPTRFGFISNEDLRACLEAASYFKGETPAELSRGLLKTLWGSWYEDAMAVYADVAPTDEYPYFPGIPNWELLLQKGMRSIIEECQGRIVLFAANHDNDVEKLHFWQAGIIACNAVVNFAGRCAKFASDMALKEPDPVRRGELEDMARMCQWVPLNPARSFHEAIQSIRLTHVALLLENGRKAAELGRIDQYLYTYFKKETQEGSLTLEKAADLIGDLVSYMARMEQILPTRTGEANQSTMQNHITLGGVTRDGQDATNELTYLAIHTLGLLGYAEPHATLRTHRDTPHWLLLKAHRVNQRVNGIPMYLNDAHIVDYMVNRGVSIEDARDYAIVGCSQPVASPQKHYKSIHLNAALGLDLALHNGVSPVTGKRIGLETGDPSTFKTFDDVYGAFKKQWNFLLRRLLRGMSLMHNEQVRVWRAPLHSTLYDGCIENGKSHLTGGCGFYPLMYAKDRCLVDVADSLTAIKKVVFEDKKITMAELLKAIKSNFEGQEGERIQRMCLSAPKYGNDIDEADVMVRDVAKFSAGVIFSENNVFGAPYSINRNGIAVHYGAGRGVGALPNGRKAKVPTADGSLSPMQGMDKNGPSALLNSALKADYKEAATAILNLKFPASLFHNPESLEKVALLTRTFILNGGLHVQYNFIDKATLLDAKKHPEKYRDLVVRVAGYSAYFVDLTPDVQDELIRRTEHNL